MNNRYSLAQLAAIYTVYKDIDPGAKNVYCCTCGRALHIESIEDCYSLWGHYLARSIAPKLKYHPDNAFAQCARCNMQCSGNIDRAYDEYIKRRFGNNHVSKLISESNRDEEYYKQFYITEIIKLSQRYNELSEIVLDSTTGEIKEDLGVESENNIAQQFDTFSPTFRQDLDILTQAMQTEPIEYERL